MKFRNITFFKLPEGFDFDRLEASLQECSLKPVSGLELATTGFVPPFDDSVAMTAELGDDALILTFARQERVLPPAAAIREELQKRAAKHVEKWGVAPDSKHRRQMREDLVVELLPRALTRTKRVNVLLLRNHHVIAVDTASRRIAEGCVSEMRRALGTFAALPVYVSLEARQKLADWLRGDNLPEGVTAGYSAQLVERGEGGGRITFNGVQSLSEDCQDLVPGACEVKKLHINQEPVASYVLGMDLVIRSLTVFETILGIDVDNEEDEFSQLRADALLIATVVSEVYGFVSAELLQSEDHDS